MAKPQLKTHAWKYTGPIFDSHTHIWNTSNLHQTVREQQQLSIESQLVIAHQTDVQAFTEQQFPGRFVFAKYLSTQHIINSDIDILLTDIASMPETGFSLAKMWAAPGWRNYYKNFKGTFRLSAAIYKPILMKPT